MDVIIGNWAELNVSKLNLDECNELTEILNEETLDMVNYLVKGEPIPDRINNKIMKNIMEFKTKGNVTGYVKQ